MTQTGHDGLPQDPLSQAYDNLQRQLSQVQNELIYWRNAALTAQRTPTGGGVAPVSQDENLGAKSIAGVDVFMLRCHAGTIQYINSSFGQYLQSRKEELVGQNLQVLRRYLSASIVDFIANPPEDQCTVRMTDEEKNTLLDIRITRQEDVTDVVLQDVTNQEVFKSYILRYIPTELRNLTEEDLNTFRYPDRRYMSVSFVDLRGFTELSEKMTPEEVRTTINNYLEEAIGAVEENHGTVDKIIGDQVMALFGAPRYYQDHALRAIKTACDQVHRINLLRQQFIELGKLLPYCGVGINTGEMVVGNIGSQNRQDYTALGAAVNLAARLCDAARPSEVLMTEATLQAALAALPEFWDFSETTWEQQDATPFTTGKVEGVYLLEGDRQNKAILIGPGVKEDPSRAEYVFRYLYSLKIKGISEILPIISVSSPKQEVTLQLDDGKVVQTESERILGKYRLLEMIKRGGMGEVWRGKDSFGNEVAVKTLIGGEIATERQIRRFKREAQMMARLVHRRICRILEVGEVDQVSFIAMEYIKGIDLADLLEWPDGQPPDYAQFQAEQFSLQSLVAEMRSGVNNLPPPVPGAVVTEATYRVLPENVTLQTMIATCGAVQYAHSHGVLHRDLKPSNIMIREEGEPVVMDFGLAKVQGQKEHEVSMSLSMSGELIGTLEYMAPEQAVDSRNITPAADVYSLGAILYQMVTGKKPFNASGNLLADIQTLQIHTVIPPRKLNRLCSQDLEIIILKALRSDPKERYATISALRGDLERYRNGEVITARSASLLDRMVKRVNRNKALSGAVGIFILLLLVAGIAYAVDSHQQNVKLQQLLEQSTLDKKAADEARKSAENALSRYEEQRRLAEKAQKDIKDKDDVITKSENFSKSMETAAYTAQANLANRSLDQAKNLLKNMRLKDAIISARQATLDAPQYADAWWWYATALSADQQFDAAAKAFDEGARFAADKNQYKQAAQKARQDLSELNSFLGQYQFRTAKGEPVSREEHLKAADMFVDGGKFTEAAAAFQAANRLPNAFSADIRVQQFMAEARKLKPDLSTKKTRFEIVDNHFRKIDLSTDGFTILPSLTGVEADELILSGLPVTDLSPLAQGKFLRIDLARTPVTDLSALRNTGVKQIVLTGSKIASLTSLSGIKLELLDLSRTAITDLSPLSDAPPDTLIVANTQVEDLGPVSGGKFQNLDVSYTQVKSPRFSAQFRAVKLNLEGSRITDVRSLAGLTIEWLDLSNTPIKDISPLEYNALKGLDISNTDVDSLISVERMPLVFLDIRMTRVRDLEPIENLPIESLRLSPQRILRGLDVVKRMPQLKQVGDEQVFTPMDFLSKVNAAAP